MLLQSLTPLRRHLQGNARIEFDRLLKRIPSHLTAYQNLSHLSPMEFILLCLMLELLPPSPEAPEHQHPPFP